MRPATFNTIGHKGRRGRTARAAGPYTGRRAPRLTSDPRAPSPARKRKSLKRTNQIYPRSFARRGSAWIQARNPASGEPGCHTSIYRKDRDVAPTEDSLFGELDRDRLRRKNEKKVPPEGKFCTYSKGSITLAWPAGLERRPKRPQWLSRTDARRGADSLRRPKKRGAPR